MACSATLPIRIVFADNMDLLRIGAQTTLAQQPDCHVLAVVADFLTLLANTQQHQPDVVVFGDGLSADLDIWDQLTQLKMITPASKFVVMSSRAGGLLIHEFLAHGIDGVLYKADELQIHLPWAIFAVMRNRPYLSPTANTEYLVTLRDPHTPETLDTEAQFILQLLAHGKHAGEIGSRLGIDKRRVYWVREKLRQHFGASTNEHLILRAAAEGFIYAHD